MAQIAPELLLRSLRDVPGVAGSFVMTSDAQLLWRDMPAYFQSDTLARIAPRAACIFESLSVDCDPAECVIRFAEHKLYLRSLPGALLCTLLTADVHMPSIRTAVNLIGRHLADELTPRADALTRAAASRQAAPPQLSTETVAKRVRVYRGQRYEE
jgi:hypothetical protein